jgi:hypothetical protein
MKESNANYKVHEMVKKLLETMRKLDKFDADVYLQHTGGTLPY